MLGSREECLDVDEGNERKQAECQALMRSKSLAFVSESYRECVVLFACWDTLFVPAKRTVLLSYTAPSSTL